MGEIFYHMGILATPEVIECSITDLAGEYLGHTRPSVLDLFDRALGKIILIDKAHLLLENYPFSKEVVAEIVGAMTNPRFGHNMFIILAGYGQGATFGDKAVRGYEEQLRRHLNDPVDYFSSQATAGKPVNITKWFELYSYDFMGDLTFGKSSGMLGAQEDHWAIHSLKQAMIPLGLYLPNWFFRVVTSIPGLSRAWQRLFEFCGERMMERIKVCSPRICQLPASSHSDKA